MNIPLIISQACWHCGINFAVQKSVGLQIIVYSEGLVYLD